MSAPFFSIIVTCRNAAGTLTRTLDSIRRQTDADRELVVVDGASNDGTAEILASFGSDITRQVSEPDRGVYDGMNKGINLASGQWLLFLGADDILAAPDVLARMRQAIGNAGPGVVCGEAVYDDGRVWRPSRRIIYRSFIHHQAAFYHHTLFANGGYDDGLGMQADYDLNLRLHRRGVAFMPVVLRVAVCGSGGLSDGGKWANYREEITVRHRHFPAWQCWFWDLLSMLRYWRKRILRMQAIARPE